MDIREVFAAILRRLRHEKGLSQEELAHKASVNRTYISKLETASTYAGLEIIAKLAKVLGTHPADLLASPANTRSRKS